MLKQYEHDYILIWNGITGRVLANEDILFDLDQKPKLPFQFKELHLNTQMNEWYYTTQGEPDQEGIAPALAIELNEEQIEACITYCDTFLDTQDYEVYVYDKEGIYRGNILKSQAKAANMEYVIAQGPEIAFSKYDKRKKAWEPVYVVFKEDGYPVFGQERPMDSDILFMTREEFEALPKQPSAVYSLNFTTYEWEDKRELDRVKFDAIMDVRIYYEHYISRNRDIGGRINPNEFPTYITQRTEAENWLKDENYPTPFLDGFISMNSNIDKKTLCERIVNNYTYDELFEQGRRHGEMYNYIYRIRAAETNADVDAIIQEVYETIGKYRIINVYRKYPAAFAKKVAVGTELAVFTGGGLTHLDAEV